MSKNKTTKIKHITLHDSYKNNFLISHRSNLSLEDGVNKYFLFKLISLNLKINKFND